MTHYSLTARAFLVVCVLAACRHEPASTRDAAGVTDPVAKGTPTRFGGEVVLTGSLAVETEGALILVVRAIGSREPLLERSYEIGDPAWLQRDNGRALTFGLDLADVMTAKPFNFSREMELVARFDADGNPATSEPESAEKAQRVQTGDSEIDLVLHRANEAGRARTARTEPR